MSFHALEVLEFERVLEGVARRASSALGGQRVRSLSPSADRGEVERRLARVAATMRFLERSPGWTLGPVPDVSAELVQLGVEGTVLEPLSIHRIGVVLRTGRLLAERLSGEAGEADLDHVAGRLVSSRETEAKIARCVDEEGAVLSSASRELERIRGRLRGAHARIVRQLEVYLSALPERYVVPDGSVTIREGRYVVPVRREGKREVGGIVHDESQTGATLYVEPPAAIESMNRLRDLERDERREIRRVLGELTAELAPLRRGLSDTLAALADFDGLAARASTALAWEGTVPEIVGDGGAGLRIVGGRHPLLLEAGAEEVVPFDLDLAPGERCLVVSGPNTGGKSVFLKAMGLTSALAQSGVVPPVGPGTRLPVYASFYADIGDEQSIARNLSTFSAHLANLSELVEGADARSLVLIDEMGTGTDPAEGAALARAILEELVARGATTVVSSHLGDLKRLDAEGSGIVNASLQFDAERMAPTYRLIKGRPGRSYGLAIARRMGFPDSVLHRAELYRGAGTAGLEDALARLELREREAEELAHDLEGARARTERLSREVERRETSVREAEETAGERARLDARRLLMEARAEVEAAIRELREAADRGESLEEAARAARRRVERAAGRQRKEPVTSAASDAASEVEPGTHVLLKATGARGQVTDVRTDRALVEVGGLRLEVPLRELRVAEPPAEAPAGARARGGWTGPPKGQARTEVDLRGLRVDEMEVELERALDQAVLEDLSQLRIIHGKGTGALRKRVEEILSEDRRVRRHRAGGPAEGGGGVTVASFEGAP